MTAQKERSLYRDASQEINWGNQYPNPHKLSTIPMTLISVPGVQELMSFENREVNDFYEPYLDLDLFDKEKSQHFLSGCMEYYCAGSCSVECGVWSAATKAQPLPRWAGWMRSDGTRQSGASHRENSD
eukprot:scaffold1132_cov159-Ochromonas_danica.AAC.2